MVEEEAKKVEAKPAPAVEAASPTSEAEPSAAKDVTEEKAMDESKAIAIVDKPLDDLKYSPISIDRDAVLARVETEKRMSLIRAWEENEKTKAENRAIKKLSAISSWENTKKAAVDAQLKQIEEELEKKKTAYAEKMKNKIAMIHKEAEEKKALVEAKKGGDLLKAEEMAAKFRATGHAPTKLFGCFGP